MKEDLDHELRLVGEYQCRNDWLKLKEAIKFELESLAKWKVLEPVIQTPEGVKPIGYK